MSRYTIYIKDTEEYQSYADFPQNGNVSHQYLDLSNGKLYRYDSSGYHEIEPLEGCPTYHGTYLKPAYIEFTSISLSTVQTFHVGDYVKYAGDVFRMYEIPQPTKQALPGRSGEAIVYSNVQFFRRSKDLEIAPFRNYVKGADGYHFSTQKDISTYENVQGIVDRLQINLDDFAGTGIWNVVIADGIEDIDVNEAKEFTFGETCLDILDSIYETWENLGWTYSIVDGVNTVTIGGANVRTDDNTTARMEYGSGLTSLKRTVSDSENDYERLRIFGSTRNMISRYYNKQDRYFIYDADSIDVPNLMIPITRWGRTNGDYDASKACIERTIIPSLEKGLKEKTVYFDGEENEEIYPSIGNVTIAELQDAKAALFKTEAGFPDYYPQDEDETKRIDVVDSVVSMPSDDGSLEEPEVYKSAVSIASTQSSSLEKKVDIASCTFTKSGTVEFTPNFSLVIDDIDNSVAIDRFDVYFGICPNESGFEPSSWVQAKDTFISSSSHRYTPDGSIKVGSDVNPASGAFKMMARIVYTPESHTDIPLHLEYHYSVTNGSVSMKLTPGTATSCVIKLRQIGFDLSTQIGTPTISMKTGMCAGREFTIPNGGVRYDSSADLWIVTLNRVTDESTSMTYPNSSYPIASGDEFVVLGIEMPEELLNVASQRLYLVGMDLFDARGGTKVYEPKIDSKFVYENRENGNYNFREGIYLKFRDAQLTGYLDTYVLIDSITINESGVIPEYAVTLRDKKAFSFAVSVKKSISSLGDTVKRISSSSARRANTAIAEGLEWGAIEGNIGKQSDLMTALGEKVGIGSWQQAGTTELLEKLSFCKQGNQVHFKGHCVGVVFSASQSEFTTLFTLPEGYRPSNEVVINVVGDSFTTANAASICIDITTGGAVRVFPRRYSGGVIQQGQTVNVYFDNVSFFIN